MRNRRTRNLLFAFALLLSSISLFSCTSSRCGETIKISFPKEPKHPFVAVTADELARLRAAWQSEGPEHKAVANMVKRADRALKTPLEFPPRGGQHNQWYQCDKCEVPLKTVDATHHKCPKCGKVYSGSPYDDVIFLRTHIRNLQNAQVCAWAFALTEDTKYLDYTRKVLLGYAERYKKYPFHGNSKYNFIYAMATGGHIFAQALETASHMTQDIAPAYDLTYNALTKEERDTIRNKLIIPMLEVMGRTSMNTGRSNWQTWLNAGMFLGGAVAHEPKWIDRAINNPKNGFLFQMEKSILPEGMWHEQSWGYHFYAMRALLATVEAARRLDIDLWSQPQLRKCFLLPAQNALPGNALPRFGDDVNTSLNHFRFFAEPIYNALKDPAVIPFLSQTPTWDSILYGRKTGTDDSARRERAGSVIFPHTGQAVLRANGEKQLTAAMIFGPSGGYHGHLDKLSFVFYGCGQELGVDPGRAASQAYRLPIHKNWYKGTLGHNAVLVDQANQSETRGKLLLYHADEKFSVLVADANRAYTGVRHRRIFCLASDWLLVGDDLKSQRTNRYDWLYHNRGKSIATSIECKPVKKATNILRHRGAIYLQNPKIGACNADTATVTFEDQRGVNTQLILANTKGAQLYTATGPGSSVNERIPMVGLVKNGGNVTFAALLSPWRKKDGTAPTFALQSEEKNDMFEVRIKDGDQTTSLRLTETALELLQNGKQVWVKKLTLDAK